MFRKAAHHAAAFARRGGKQQQRVFSRWSGAREISERNRKHNVCHTMPIGLAACWLALCVRYSARILLAMRHDASQPVLRVEGVAIPMLIDQDFANNSSLWTRATVIMPMGRSQQALSDSKLK